MQANSVGSTANTRNREMVSCRKRISTLASAIGPWELPPAEASGGTSSGQLSRGRDHWMAPRRKSSLQASSSRITCVQRGRDCAGLDSLSDPLCSPVPSGGTGATPDSSRPRLPGFHPEPHLEHCGKLGAMGR